MADFTRLTDYATLSNDPKIAKVVEIAYFNGSIIAGHVPFMVKKSLKVNGAREDNNFPTVTFMDINDDNIPSHSSEVKQFSEQAVLVRQHVKTDIALSQDENQFINPHAHKISRFMKSFAYDTNNKFINNDPKTGNNKAFAGIRARLDDPATYGTLTGNKLNGAGVDLTPANSTAKTFATFCEKLDELLWRVGNPDGSGVVLYMPKELIWRITRLGREYAGSGGFGTATDQIGRTVSTYKNAILHDPGMLADQSTNIITTTEANTGANGSSDYTSVYAVRYGEDGMAGWTHLPLTIKDVPDPAGIFKVDLIQWCGGIICPDSRAIGRIYNIKIK